jgi:hypothetical protein
MQIKRFALRAVSAYWFAPQVMPMERRHGARYPAPMTRLSSIPEHEIAIECRVCGHAGLVPVVPILAKGDRTVAQLVAATRCSWCRAKIVGTYRIVYGGRSDIAMAMTASMPQDT